jgi:hypothetical protein
VRELPRHARAARRLAEGRAPRARHCNDCHTPHDFLRKYLTKMDHGWRHSKGFTLNDFHEPIRITAKDLLDVRENCLRCHAGLVSGIAHTAGTPSFDEHSRLRALPRGRRPRSGTLTRAVHHPSPRTKRTSDEEVRPRSRSSSSAPWPRGVCSRSSRTSTSARAEARQSSCASRTSTRPRSIRPCGARTSRGKYDATSARSTSRAPH